jgi:hypothetical protein
MLPIAAPGTSTWPARRASCCLSRFTRSILTPTALQSSTTFNPGSEVEMQRKKIRPQITQIALIKKNHQSRTS